MEIAYTKKVLFSFEDALEKTKLTLTNYGFGILSVIDVKKSLQKKLKKDVGKYTIIGACHPPSAYAVLKKRKDFGLMMPCNVVVYEEDSHVFVSAVKPSAIINVFKEENLEEVAEDLEKGLRVVLDIVEENNTRV